MSKKLQEAIKNKKVLEYFKSLKDEAKAFKELDILDQAYYDGNGYLDDVEYDVLRDYLNLHYPSIKEKVGKTVDELSLLNKETLSIPMGSLEKENNYEDLKKWYEKYTTKEVLGTLKIDGSSIELTFVDGIFTKAVTRGTGFVGSNITANAKKMEFPKKISLKGEVKIRGEVVLFLSKFDKHFQTIGYSNARNSVAGIMSALDKESSELCKHLNIIAFDIFCDKKTTTKKEKFDLLKQEKFQLPLPVVINDFDKIQSHIEKISNIRETLDFLIDGVVLEENDLAHYESQGIVKNRPKAARAYKFESATAETILKDVIWQVGKTGRITPVGIVEPTYIQGVTITNVMLNNYEYITENNIDLGAKVLLARANDVIPKIISTIKPSGKKIPIIKKCPSCNSKLDISDLQHITCTNHEECPLQSIYKITFYLKTLEVKGMADKMIEKMIDEKIIEDINDLYTIDFEKVKTTEGLSYKNVKKAYDELIEKSKSVKLSRFIKSLSIKGIGESITELAMIKYPTLDQMYKADVETLQSINGIGEETSEYFVIGLKQKKPLIDKILPYIKFEEKVEGKLSNKSYCFTGFRDSDLKKLIESKGGKVADSYSKNIDVLICIDPSESSSKIEKAKKDGKTIMAKDIFEKSLKE